MNKQQARARLEEERRRLNRVLDGLRTDLEVEADAQGSGELSTVDQHPADIGSEVFEHEKNQSLLEQVQAELVEVDKAFSRVDGGSYGICQACQRPIATERLEAMPATRFCVEDQARAERDLGLPGVRA